MPRWQASGKRGWQNTVKVLIDTNVIIDFLENRMPFALQAEELIEHCVMGRMKGALTASAATDIYYILHKPIGHEQLLKQLRLLFTDLEVIAVGLKELLLAMDTGFDDYEDSLVSVCAQKIEADFVITRNTKHFSRSLIPPLTPTEFLANWNTHVQ